METMTTLAVVGSRDFSDYQEMERRLNDWVAAHGVPSLVVSGGARGADTLAKLWCINHNVSLKEFLPDWSVGRHAGILRNTTIVDAADAMVAFPRGKSPGTRDSLAKARKKGIPVEVWE